MNIQLMGGAREEGQKVGEISQGGLRSMEIDQLILINIITNITINNNFKS